MTTNDLHELFLRLSARVDALQTLGETLAKQLNELSERQNVINHRQTQAIENAIRMATIANENNRRHTNPHHD